MVDLQNGYPFDSAEFDSAGPTPLVRIRDLSASDFETFLPFDVPDEQAILPGDLVVGMDGDFTVRIWDRPRAALNQRLCRLRVKNGVADLRFVAYALPQQLERIHATQFATTVKHLSSREILGCRLPAKSLPEQSRIANFLDERVSRIDRIIAARRKQATAVVEEYEAARASAVLSSEWPERRLSHVARMGTGHTPSRSNVDYWRDCTIPWLTTGDVHRFRKDEIDVLTDTTLQISELGLKNSAAILHPAGTVALSRTASAGFSIVMGRDMATSQDFATWTCRDGLLPEFLLHVLRARRSFLLGYLSMGTTHKTIYFPDLMDLTVGLPPLADQRSAVADVSLYGESRTQVLAALEKQVALLAEYKTSLISAVVTGELDVTTAGSGIPV